MSEVITVPNNSSRELSAWINIAGGPALFGSDSPGEDPPAIFDIPGFDIGRHAVSNREFNNFLEDGGYSRAEFWSEEGLSWLKSLAVREPAFWRDPLFNSPDQPATGISFYEAQAYAAWASARLPTELEWEKAARGPDGLLYPWGYENPDVSRANFAPGYVPINISPIDVQECARGDSPYGCRQMAGNVYEWCVDFYHFDTPGRRSSQNLVELRPARRRVMKGGSWGVGPSRLRPAARWSSPPEMRDNVGGFRLVKDANTP